MKQPIAIGGMSRDLSQWRHEGEAAYEIRNMRLMPVDRDHTLGALSNERGPLLMDVEVHGTPTGTFAINDWFGVYSYDNDASYITVYRRVSTKDEERDYKEVFRYEDRSGVLDFRACGYEVNFPAWKDGFQSYPSYESATSIRVYWIDSVHELRVMDFLDLIGRCEDGRQVYDDVDGVMVVRDAYLDPNYFSYLPTVYRITDAEVTKKMSGAFHGGTVQFCVTEVVNANESNIVYYSPLYYCSDDAGNRGFPDENEDAGCSFDVSFRLVGDSDAPITNFIVYCIHRLVRDGAPMVYRRDIKVVDRGLPYTTTFTGEEEQASSDYLLFKNSLRMRGMRGMTMKDNTMFLANYRKDAVTAMDDDLPKDLSIETDYKEPLDAGTFNGHTYSHVSQLKRNSWEIGHFKHGQEYLLGYQLMDATGAWGEPVLCEMRKMDKAPEVTNSTVALPYFKGTVKATDIPEKYKAIRPVVAYVSRSRERFKCQGIVTPTIFCESERATGQCYAKYSPFARTFVPSTAYNPLDRFVNPSKVLHLYPDISGHYQLVDDVATVHVDYDTNQSVYYVRHGYYPQHNTDYTDVDMMQGTYPASHHLEALGSSCDYNCEIQSCAVPSEVAFRTAIYPMDAANAFEGEKAEGTAPSEFLTIDNTKYYVDCSTVAVNSPDIRDDNGESFSDSKVNLVGTVDMSGFASDCDIVAGAAPTFKDNKFASGFAGYKPFATAGGRCAMTIPNWCAPFDNGSLVVAFEGYNSGGKPSPVSFLIKPYWAVYPFQRNKGLSPINDSPDGGEFSQLEYKQLANYRYSALNRYIFDRKYDGSRCWFSDGKQNTMSVMDYGDKLIYKGAEDTVVNLSTTFMFTNGASIFATNGEDTRWSSHVRKIANKDCTTMAIGVVWKPNLTTREEVESTSTDDNGNTTTTSETHYDTRDSYDTTKLMISRASGSFFFTEDMTFAFTAYEPNMNHYQAGNGFNSADLNHGDWKLVSVKRGTSPIWNLARADNGYDPDDSPDSVSVNLKYNAWPHLVCKLGKEDGKELILPNTGRLLERAKEFYQSYRHFSLWHEVPTEWDEACPFKIDDYLTSTPNTGKDQLWLADIVNYEGDYSEEVDATAATSWYMAGPAAWTADGGTLELKWYQGDWYFQRYEALRTYASSTTDVNQYVEIVSFYCETKTNIDGRYDRNRGRPFLQANPTNFNLINESYTQLPNYFVYTQYSKASNVEDTFPCQVTWSMPKVLNSTVDEWTNITGASFMDLDGDKGEVVKLIRFKDYIYAFQQNGIAVVLFNSRAAIPTDTGVPIELGNSGKVEGKQYLSNSMGAVNARSVLSTDTAVYFVDTYNRAYMMFGGETGLGAISERNGFHAWMVRRDNSRQILLRDDYNKCVMLQDVPVPDDEVGEATLSYSERLQALESFYDYQDVLETINVTDDTLLVHYDRKKGDWNIWRMNAGEYNEFFGFVKPYWVDFVARGAVGQGFTHANVDKTWSNVEFRGDMFYQRKGGETFLGARCPFNRLRAYTEYQDTWLQALTFRKDWHSNASNLKQKFRIWDAILPRDEEGVYSKPHFKNRIRNPWAHIVLRFEPENAPIGAVEGVGDNVTFDRCRAVIQGIEVAYV